MIDCPHCLAPARHWFKWRGYYRLRCDNGHWFNIATPKQAARNWAKLKMP